MCKTINECRLFVLSESNPNLENDDEESNDSDEDFYSSLCEENNTLKFNNISETLESGHLNIIYLQALTILNSKKKELNLLDKYPTIKQFFLNIMLLFRLQHLLKGSSMDLYKYTNCTKSPRR